MNYSTNNGSDIICKKGDQEIGWLKFVTWRPSTDIYSQSYSGYLVFSGWWVNIPELNYDPEDMTAVSFDPFDIHIDSYDVFGNPDRWILEDCRLVPFTRRIRWSVAYGFQALNVTKA